jgi:P-type Cu+ transporter
MKKIKLSISGMHCASCGSNISRSLKSITGVKDANISVLMKSGMVDADDSVNPDDIKKAVERVGYKVTSLVVQ